MDLILTMANLVGGNCYGSAEVRSLSSGALHPDELANMPEFNGNGSRVKIRTNINLLGLSILLKIFSYLTPSDLLLYRFVSRHWNRHISSSPQFLSSFLIRLTSDPTSIETFKSSSIAWQNIRMSMSNLDPAILTPSHCLKLINLLHLDLCKMTWSTLVRLIEVPIALENLQLADCSILENQQDSDESTSNALSTLKGLSISSSNSLLDSTLKILSNFNGHESILERFSITVTPMQETWKKCEESSEKFERLLFEVLDLMNRNESSLKSLSLNFRNRKLLTSFCTKVLENYRGIMPDLEEFHLCPFTSEDFDPSHRTCCTDASPSSLIDFIGRHVRLKTISFPNFQGSDAKKRRIFRSLPSSVIDLNVPGHSYIVPEFLTQLPQLKSIVIGNCGNRAFHPNGLRYNPEICKKINRIGVFSKIHMSSGKLVNFAWKFPALTSLEFDALRPILNDVDLQSIISNCRWLRHLSISDCDFITDAGLTGASLEWCRDIFRLGVIYFSTPDLVPRRGHFGPICNIKGLMTLKLAGNSSMTDVGLYFGLRFLELRHLWLPFADQVTSWGVGQLGRWNPSLEHLSICGTDIRNFTALQDLASTHPRLSVDNIFVDRWYKSPQHRLSSPSMLTAVASRPEP